MSEIQIFERDGWRLTTQGYVREHWRIYHAQSWCVACREQMVAHNFVDALSALAWVQAACGVLGEKAGSLFKHIGTPLDASEQASVDRLRLEMLTDTIAGALRLFGKRVLMKSGVKGRVVAMDINGLIQVENENEQNQYRYWFALMEVEKMLP